MARYTFAKFGSRKPGEVAPAPFLTPLPLIEGDSSDSKHYWWTELESCSFGLTAAERTDDAKAQSDDKNKPRPSVHKVTLTKKVDWGSADLFEKCCEAPEALKKKSDEDQAFGRLDSVIVEVCRESGVASEGQIPFLTVTYKKVCITSYGVEFSGPDPKETIEFQFEEAQFEYVATDPYTGGVKKAGSGKATGMVNYPQPKPAPDAEAAAAAAGGGAAAAPGAGAHGAASAAAHSATDAVVSVNFPGFQGVIGTGVLPG